ncbi:hypothetical protein M758_4G059500 [Ceratodon purpureus]|nr:hypothetical protein M758_4G059500 [Ceratodon purpureus]KAG0618385.1 hypothetical protein M758_4G059500 [Ceratodon purpureus]
MFERDRREMPVVDSVTPGVSPSAVPFSATASSRKEKKKQAKEERDRLKQAEKKKRRLEKALATAAAIRTELEKKKQRRKEEEQRLDEEGAALAEAVALQVLVDEESDGLGRLHVAKDGEIQSFRDGDDGGSSSGDKVSEDKNVGPCLGVRRRETVQQNGLKRHGSFKSSGDNDRSFERESKEWKRREWEAPGDSLLINARDDAGLDSELEDEEEATWDVFSSAEEKARASNERARRAEVAAGQAAAQVMTLL